MNHNVETKSITRDAEEERVLLERLKYRIINVIPPGTEYLEILLKLSEIQWTETIPTAAITCGGSPRLLFNREFVDHYCALDEDLMMLVLHELHHVLYGHHVLFQGAGEAHNIAFDAIINARLCRGWKTARHARLFRRLYPQPGFPEILLCPPPGWPNETTVEDIQREKERLKKTLDSGFVWDIQALRGKLYLGSPDDTTYEDILRLLRKHPPESAPPLLLGSHKQQGANKEQADPGNDAASDPFLVDMARAMDRYLKNEESGRNAGGAMGLSEIDPAKKNPRINFLTALRAVLVRAGVYQQRASRHRRRAMADTLRQSVSILPEWRDRTIAAKEMLLDTAPLLYTREIPARARLWMPSRQAHIYLDVSGSMCNDLPWIISALAPLEKAGLCRIYLFSTEVFEIPKGDIGKKPLKTTWGTEIKCVLRHLMEIPAKKRPRQAVVLTDGYFEHPRAPLMQKFKETGIGLHGAITHTGAIEPMNSIAVSVTEMPAYQ
jgi:hypothetical protein